MMSTAMSITPAEVRAIRLRLGLTQKELADRMNVSRDAVVNWENDRCGVSGPAEVLLRHMLASADKKASA